MILRPLIPLGQQIKARCCGAGGILVQRNRRLRPLQKDFGFQSHDVHASLVAQMNTKLCKPTPEHNLVCFPPLFDGTYAEK